MSNGKTVKILQTLIKFDAFLDLMKETFLCYVFTTSLDLVLLSAQLLLQSVVNTNLVPVEVYILSKHFQAWVIIGIMHRKVVDNDPLLLINEFLYFLKVG